MWEVRAVVESSRDKQTRLRVAQFGIHRRLEKNKMTDVSMRLRLKKLVKIIIHE